MHVRVQVAETHQHAIERYGTQAAVISSISCGVMYMFPLRPDSVRS